MGDFNGIHDSLNRLLAPFWFTNLYFKQLRPSTRTPSYLDTFILHALSNIVTGNQGLLVLNTNVTVSRNLYWSTLSALIAWPGPWDGRATRRDWIWKVPPSPIRVRARRQSYPPQFSSTSTSQKKKKKERKFQGSNLSRRVCVSAARPINQSAEGGEQRGRRRRQRVRQCGRARKDASAASPAALREVVCKKRWRVFVIGDVMSYESDKAAKCLNHHRASLTSGRTDEWTPVLPLSNLFFFSPLFFAPISFFIHFFFFFAQCNESFTWLTRLDPFTNLSSLFLVSVRQRAARHMSLPASATKAVLIGRAVPGPSQDGCAGLQAWIVCDLTALQGWSSESPFFFFPFFKFWSHSLKNGFLFQKFQNLN